MERVWATPELPGFTKWSHARFRYDKEKSDDGFFVQQQFVREYLGHESPFKGLLLYHGLGSGKTAGAIATSEALRSAGKRVFVMLPASLEANYIGEVRKFGGESYSQERSWRFVSQAMISTDETAARMPIDAKIIRRFGGVWVDDAVKGTAFEKLAPTQQDHVLQQLENVVKNTHTFVRYNGPTSITIKMLASQEENPFDDAVVVVDEVHNFISSVMNGGIVGVLYDRIMSASNCKVVLLSGTPVVNSPLELSFLINLAHGYVDVYEINVHHVPLSIDTDARVLEYETIISGGKTSISIRFCPEGFARNADGLLERIEPWSTADLLAQLAPNASYTVRRVLLLPIDPVTFENVFIDTKTNRIKHQDVIARRCMGVISYYRGHDPSLYPRTGSPHIIRLPMSETQFHEYATVRHVERQRERLAKQAKARAKNNQGQADESAQQMYRTFSRTVCNFVFPEDIPRPKRNNMTEEELYEANDMRQKRYIRELDDAIQQLRGSDEHLVLDKNLPALSPKFAAIVKRLIQNPLNGTSIVYSVFRRAEGVNILGAALEANGFQEIRLIRDPESGTLLLDSTGWDAKKPRFMIFSNEDTDITKCMLAIFNNEFHKVPSNIRASISNAMGIDAADVTNLRGEIVRTLMITKSGAEGIDTKNVREVHIVEPYWHAVRVQQVIGRAARANSHIALPKADRTVESFVYVSMFTQDQRARDKDIMKHDNGLTSDEYIQQLAIRKWKLINDVLDIMKRSAVDCVLHRGKNQIKDCYEPTPYKNQRFNRSVDIMSNVKADEKQQLARKSKQPSASRKSKSAT